MAMVLTTVMGEVFKCVGAPVGAADCWPQASSGRPESSSPVEMQKSSLGLDFLCKRGFGQRDGSSRPPLKKKKKNGSALAELQF